jgi:autotransporter-associated beta strand protein
VTGESLTLNDGGIATDGALRNVSGNNTWTGTVTLGSASRINSDAGTLTLSGAIGGATQNLTVGGSGNTAISGVIGTTTGSLTKEGAGMLTLSGANAYTGTTTISAGVLNIQNADALGTASNTSTTTVANGAVLQIANNITTTNKGTLILNGSGTGSGALQNVSGNNTWNSAITLASDATVFSSAAGSTLNLSTDYATAYTLTMGRSGKRVGQRKCWCGGGYRRTHQEWHRKADFLRIQHFLHRGHCRKRRIPGPHSRTIYAGMVWDQRSADDWHRTVQSSPDGYRQRQHPVE